MARAFFTKIVHLHDLLSLDSRSLVQLPDVQSKFILLQFNLLAPKWLFLVAGVLYFIISTAP